MASEDLVASMKTLDLGPSDESKTPDVNVVEDVSRKSPRRKAKTLQKQGVVRSEDDLSTASFHQQTLQEMKIFNTTSVENAQTGALPTPPSRNNKNRPPRNRNKKGNGAKSTSGPSALPAKAEKSSYQTSSLNVPQGENKITSVYIIEASTFRAVEIVGTFTLLSRANERVEEYITQCGMSNANTVDSCSGFGFEGPKPQDIPKFAVSRRGPWASGASETCIPQNRTGVRKFRVLPKDSTFSEKDTGFGTAYLAMDGSGLGLMALGVYHTKEQAWQACERYWIQLSFLSEMEKEKEWFDEKGMHHVRGSVAGRAHHFFVERHVLNPKVGADLRIVFGQKASA
jgi:hypothetical protein